MSELLEKILDKRNMNEAYKKVCANKGAGGVDGMEIDELDGYIRGNWESIKEQIRKRSYTPQPVRRVEIPKSNGSKRKLGIPTVMDRVIQQGIAQVISPMCEPLFSENSNGFRPNRSCEMAIREMLVFLKEGYEWIVDIDLEKFFDNVPQDKLMSLVHNIINDGDTESLIRKYLKAGVMIQGRYEKTDRGTPQGVNLSPLLSNIMLNELDKELEKRGLRFVRYADDCVIAVRSEASAKRVMYSITDWIERKLALKVNAEKTHITRPGKLKYLGFGFYKDPKAKEWKCRPHGEIRGKIQTNTKETDKQKPEHGICGKGAEAEQGNQRVDKLLCVRLNENGNERHRRSFAYKAKSNHLEAMESTVKTAMGIAEAGNRKRPGKSDSILRQPLPMDSDQNVCSQGNLKRKTVTGGACKLL